MVYLPSQVDDEEHRAAYSDSMETICDVQHVQLTSSELGCKTQVRYWSIRVANLQHPTSSSSKLESGVVTSCYQVITGGEALDVDARILLTFDVKKAANSSAVCRLCDCGCPYNPAYNVEYN